MRLAMALSSVAAMAVGRIVKLMQPELTQLPRYLSPIGGASAGFVSMQKTAVALYGEIRRHANPACLDQFAVSETVEDHSSRAPLVYAKLADQVAALERLVALEMLVAAPGVVDGLQDPGASASRPRFTRRSAGSVPPSKRRTRMRRGRREDHELRFVRWRWSKLPCGTSPGQVALCFGGGRTAHALPRSREEACAIFA